MCTVSTFPMNVRYDEHLHYKTKKKTPQLMKSFTLTRSFTSVNFIFEKRGKKGEESTANITIHNNLFFFLSIKQVTRGGVLCL